MLTMYLLLSLSFLLLVWYLTRSGKTRRLPPGPWALPIIGNLLSIDRREPQESLSRIAWEYGPVCGIWMGSVYTVLISDVRILRQVFSKDAFSGRAPLYVTHGIMKGHGLIAAEGELWREQRKFSATCLKNMGMVKFPGPRRDHLEEMIRASVDEALPKLEEHSKKDGGLYIYDTVHHCLGNLINLIVFGKVYEEDDEEWKWLKKVQQEGARYVGISGPLNFLPILRFLPRYGNTMQFIVEGQRKTHEVYRKILEDHRKRPGEMSSFLAAYDEEMKRRAASGEPLGSFTETQCFYLLADMYGAGVETTLATLRWFLLYMAAFPEEQAKIQEEIDNVVGEKEPTLEDRPALPRLEAAIMEVQRLRSVVPIGIPHGTTEDTRIEDYDIPKGSMIVPLQWAIHMDPRNWSEPRKFEPRRFLEEDGSGLAKCEAFLPYQLGKRMCVGDELARMILFLYAARILRRFRVEPATPDGAVDLEGVVGITLTPKRQRLRFQVRR